MKPLSYFFFLCAMLLTVSCSSEDDGPTPNGNDIIEDESLLVGTFEGVSFTAAVPSGIVETALSGVLVFGETGNYSSTISPFSLNEEAGTWGYLEDDQKIIFNEGEATEEVAENVRVTTDSLFFRINRGEENNMTTIDFKLVRLE